MFTHTRRRTGNGVTNAVVVKWLPQRAAYSASLSTGLEALLVIVPQKVTCWSVLAASTRTGWSECYSYRTYTHVTSSKDLLPRPISK